MSQGKQTKSIKTILTSFLIILVEIMFLFLFFYIKLYNTSTLLTQVPYYLKWDTNMSD